MKAISSFDLESGISFYGFLSFWVKRIIQTFSTSYPYLVHVPINKLFLLDSFEIRVQKYLQEYEFMPSCEILEYENLSEKETKWAYDLLCNIDSMVYPLKEETLYADEQYSPDSNLEMDSLRYRLEQNLYFLSVREQDIITSYFNLNGQGEESSYDIAERYNMSRERIRQIYERGKKRLRILYKFHYLPSLLTTAEREYVMARFDARRVETYSKNLMISKRTEDESKKAGEYKTLFKERNYEKERTSIAQDTSENHTQQKPVQRVQENKVVSSNTILRLAKIGERIIYDEKLGTVINKITMGGFARLIIEYDDGTIDNVPNNTKRYRII
jgi:RNA polymerase sigma factor (sigma-70 family)